MTRINVLQVNELCDQHLIAEWRELTRIPNKLCANKYNHSLPYPVEYTIRTEANPEGGKGHERFFVHKLTYLFKRYRSLVQEAQKRGFNCVNRWPADAINLPAKYWKDYTPTDKAKKLNKTRILERTPKNPHYYSKKVACIKELDK